MVGVVMLGSVSSAFINSLSMADVVREFQINIHSYGQMLQS